MIRKQFARIGAALAVVGVVGLAAAPAASAQGVIVVPRVPVGPVGGPVLSRDAVIPAPLLPPPAPPPVPIIPPAPVPPVLPPPVLPVLQQLFPGAGLAQNPPQLFPLQGNTYGVNSSLLFCGVDQAGNCERMAQQLAQVSPGWGTTVTNGPQGYGVYLTYQRA
jgi:hypothetical protein